VSCIFWGEKIYFYILHWEKDDVFGMIRWKESKMGKTKWIMEFTFKIKTTGIAESVEKILNQLEFLN
jgi:hypothetical protein